MYKSASVADMHGGNKNEGNIGGTTGKFFSNRSSLGKTKPVSFTNIIQKNI
jgi:hypothetical protein